ncbi:hypothetical protein FRACA_130013 [Frankia canadensis]|uniref:Uncharacterized protein n=1 Tax=Frankia canadensis TaxID=1836972 RepID=A0A2I2KKJ3_9ACTN|nr:hypothetical protein FRACA_130013 [Frankia canadensis]SOU53479.1 hypothetical protein FRACA_130013 [Frankia canadensis]
MPRIARPQPRNLPICSAGPATRYLVADTLWSVPDGPIVLLCARVLVSVGCVPDRGCGAADTPTPSRAPRCDASYEEA